MGTTSFPTKTADELPERREADFYPTDIRLVVAALNEYSFLLHFGRRKPMILDPSAGLGVWGGAAHYMIPGSVVYGVDIRKLDRAIGFDHWFNKTDFLDFDPGKTKFDLICTNPPFSKMLPCKDNPKKFYPEKPPLWEKFFFRAWSMLAPGGRIIFLLKTDVANGTKRYNGIWRTHPPIYQAPCNPRPSHNGDGSTNKNDLSLFVWEKSKIGDHSLGIPGQWITKPINWIEVYQKWAHENEFTDLKIWGYYGN